MALLEPREARITILIVLLVNTLGLITYLVSASSFNTQVEVFSKLSRHGLPVNSKVIESRPMGSNLHSVVFSYTINGMEYRYRSNVSDMEGKGYPVGSEKRLIYLPDKPSVASLDPGKSLDRIALLRALFMGLPAFISVGVFFFVVVRSKQRKRCVMTP